MPPRRKAKKGVKRTEEDKKEIPRQEKKEDFVDEEAERQAAAIRAIRDVEIEHTLTALDLLCSYFTEEQIQTPVLGFFKDNLPDLSIARNEESGEIELKWNDLDGVDVNDSILKRLSMGFPDLYNNSRPSLGGYNNGKWAEALFWNDTKDSEATKTWRDNAFCTWLSFGCL